VSARTRIGALALTLVAFAWLYASRDRINTSAFGYDFVAFYCGASIASEGGDPYRTEPLRTCEHRVGRQFRPDSRLVVPAPLPGYALAFVAPLTRLSYPRALAFWSVLLLLAYAVCVVTVIRLSGLSLPVVIAATALSLGIVSLFLGQLVPIALAALCLAATAVERKRPSEAAAWCALALLEPHLALPAIAALFVARRAMRAPLAIALGALVALSFAFLGPALNFEYVARVLHAQVASEIARSDQLSPVALAYHLGLNENVAVTLGSATYVAAAALGVALALAATRRGGARAALVLVPPAIALLGAPYIHVQHLAFALPAALFLLGRTEWKAPAMLAVFLLAIPWIVPYDATPLAPFAALAVAVLACGLLGLSPLRGAGLGLAAAALVFLIQASLAPHVPPPPSAYAAISGTDLAQADWRILIAAGFRDDVPLLTALALPTWIALIALVVAAIAAAKKHAFLRASAAH